MFASTALGATEDGGFCITAQGGTLVNVTPRYSSTVVTMAVAWEVALP